MTLNHTIWKTLVDQSNQLKKPTQISQIINTDDIAYIKGLILEIINLFLEKGDYHLGLKTYINQNLDHQVIFKMIENPPQSNQSIEEWCIQIFGEEKFGMVLNTLEGYHNDFSEMAAKLVSPLLKEAGLPLEGLSFLFFMGNYGFTPFGIHKESRGEEGVLFHLGPGKKTFYTWDTPEYNAVEHYTDAIRNIDEMLPHAQAYELEPGDAMFIPHQVFHIADSSEFSLSFVMDYINPPTDKFENKLLQAAAKEDLYLKDDYQTPILSELPSHIDKTTILEKVDIAYRRQLLELKSNAGIIRPSQFLKNNHLPNGIFKIKGKPIFPLLLDKHGEDKVIVFARGHRILKPSHKNINSVLKDINNGKVLTTEDLFTKLLPEWDIVEVYSFVGDLLQIDALEVEESM